MKEKAEKIERIKEQISKIHRIMRSVFDSQMKNYDITPSQFEVLMSLWAEDGLVLSDIGRRLFRDGPTITGIIDRLEQKKLVRRERSTKDRRVIRVFVTQKGFKLNENLMKVQDEAGRLIMKDFSDKDIDILEKILDKFLSVVADKTANSK